MRISYRCDEMMNTRLNETAHKMGISKNCLIDAIIRHYFSQNQHTEKIISYRQHCYNKKELLSGIYSVNQKLAQIVEEINAFKILLSNELKIEEVREIFSSINREIVQSLLDISKNLECLQKKMK